MIRFSALDLDRRIGMVLFDIQKVKNYKEEILQILKASFGWSNDQYEIQADLLNQSLKTI